MISVISMNSDHDSGCGSQNSESQPATDTDTILGIAPMSGKVQLFSKMSSAFIKCTVIIALMAFNLHHHSLLPRVNQSLSLSSLHWSPKHEGMNVVLCLHFLFYVSEKATNEHII